MNVAYAYWLYSQNKCIRTVSGSMVVHQGISDELELAGCRSPELFFAAVAYIDTLTDHVQNNMQRAVTKLGPINLVFYTE